MLLIEFLWILKSQEKWDFVQRMKKSDKISRNVIVISCLCNKQEETAHLRNIRSLPIGFFRNDIYIFYLNCIKMSLIEKKQIIKKMLTILKLEIIFDSQDSFCEYVMCFFSSIFKKIRVKMLCKKWCSLSCWKE